jgi:hypothetical protein
VLTKQDARGSGYKITYAYNDALGRLSGKTYADGTPAVGYSYDQTNYNGFIDYQRYRAAHGDE